ncbi:MAG: hypothetical protein AAGI38_14345 [Bacteroidota bacterium]
MLIQAKKFGPLSVLLFYLSLSLFIFSGCKQDSSQGKSAYMDYFVPYQDMLSQRAVTTDAPNEQDILTAMAYYNDGNFSQAIPFFLKALAEQPRDIPLNFYLGVSHIGNHAPEPAIPFLKQVAEQRDTPLAVPALWYLGLAYLQTGDRVNAVPCFFDLKIRNTSYKIQATKVLQTIPEGEQFLYAARTGKTFHIGLAGFNSLDYFRIDDNNTVAIRTSHNEKKLHVRFNRDIGGTSVIRLYDGDGQLLHIEKLTPAEAGVEKDVDLAFLEPGNFTLQVEMEEKDPLRQRIKVH